MLNSTILSHTKLLFKSIGSLRQVAREAKFSGLVLKFRHNITINYRQQRTSSWRKNHGKGLQ